MWNISIDHLNGGWKPELNIYIAYGDILKTVMALSKAYPGERISLSAKARVRMVVLDEKIENETKDLNDLYLDVDSGDAYAWENLLVFHEE